jgi:hypothetical protein
VDVSSSPRLTTLPEAVPPAAGPLACRPIGRLQRDEVVILLYELSDRGTGALCGYQSVVLSAGAAAHA